MAKSPVESLSIEYIDANAHIRMANSRGMINIREHSLTDSYCSKIWPITDTPTFAQSEWLLKFDLNSRSSSIEILAKMRRMVREVKAISLILWHVEFYSKYEFYTFIFITWSMGTAIAKKSKAIIFSLSISHASQSISWFIATPSKRSWRIDPLISKLMRTGLL